MKNRLYAVAAVLLLFAAPSVAANGGQPGHGGQSNQGGQPSQNTGASFEQRKANILNRIDQRLARLQEVRGCVSAATTPQAMRACMGQQGGEPGQGEQNKGD